MEQMLQICKVFLNLGSSLLRLFTNSQVLPEYISRNVSGSVDLRVSHMRLRGQFGPVLAYIEGFGGNFDLFWPYFEHVLAYFGMFWPIFGVLEAILTYLALF